MTDVTRGREETELENERVDRFAQIEKRFISACHDEGKSRELSIAMTKMEEAVMWAIRHITNRRGGNGGAGT